VALPEEQTCLPLGSAQARAGIMSFDPALEIFNNRKKI